MNTKVIIGIVVVAVAVGGIGIFLGGNGGSASTSDKSKESFDQVPLFALTDYDGNEITPKDFKGKALVLNIWATWCPFCVDELPDFALLQEAFPDDIAVIAINRAEPQATAKDYTDRELNITEKLVFLVDPQDSFYRSIGGFSMPETLFVDAKGNIRIHKRGPMKFDEMKEKVELIL